MAGGVSIAKPSEDDNQKAKFERKAPVKPKETVRRDKVINSGPETWKQRERRLNREARRRK